MFIVCSYLPFLCCCVISLFFFLHGPIEYELFLNRSTWSIDCSFKVSKFEIQSHYYIHFWTNTHGKAMNPLIHPAMSEIVSLLYVYKDGFDIKSPMKVNWTLTNITTPSVNLGVIAMKVYSTLPRSPEQKPHYHIQFSVLPRTLFFLAGGVLLLYRGCSHHILSPSTE